MSEYGLPVLYSLLIWWFSTGVVLYLDGLPRRTFRWSMLGATALLLVALYGLADSRNDESVASAYVAFSSALMVWAWVELSFLMGFITGPRRTACARGCSGWRHFGHGVQAVLYHELVLLAAAAAVVTVTRDGANQVGTWTFMILWGMRTSAKLNVFLGVRNLSEEFLPQHLRYLESFFSRKAMNLLFPVSITVSTAIGTFLLLEALARDANAFDVAGYTLLASLMTLAVLEHWFLVLPLPATALWSWGLRSRDMHDSRNGSAIARRADPDLSASASPVLAPELLLTANIEIERPGRACTPPSPRQRR
jgi:putative photosynthetic complex assembly protein 2